jgi:single-stranded-DNA-specific exonuclease
LTAGVTPPKPETGSRAAGRPRRIPRDWRLAAADPPDDFETRSSPLLRKVLWARRSAIVDAHDFLHAEEAPLHPPEMMTSMTPAVEMVRSAIQAGRRIAIFGDYDADGVTATALLQRGLTAAGAEVVTYIPHRVNDGYGLSPEGLEDLHRQGAGLVISCDCGTNSVEVVAARPAGMQLIVTDHHLPAPEIAKPDALLNPHQPGDAYPFKELSGAGVAFKLVQALEETGIGGLDAAVLEQLIQLVAVGAIADVVALVDENRTLVRRGLREMEERPLPGIAALIETGMLRRPLNSTAVGFQLAPRINAAGRMADARLALDVLVADDMEMARPLAERMESHNQSRREATDIALNEAVERLEEAGVPESAIVLADERWSLGLVGLIAGRLVDAYNMPAFVLNRGDSESRGSARSVDGFNVVDALTSCAGMLSRFGGHQAAAGFACANRDLPALVEALQAYAALKRPEDGWSRVMAIDAEVGFDELSTEAVEDLALLEPFGQGNRPPRFCGRGLVLKAATAFGGEREHLRLWLGGADRVVEAIAWRRGAYLDDYRRLAERGRRLDVLFSPEVSRWDGEATVRLELEDVRAAIPQPA